MSVRAKRHQQIAEQIRVIHQANHETYGALRVHAELVDKGELCGKNTLAQLMRSKVIVPKTVRKFRAARAGSKTTPARNLVVQRFKATRPHAPWLRHVT